VNLVEDARANPFGETAVARGARAELLRQCLPLAAGLQAVHDAGEDAPVVDTWPPAFGLRRLGRQKRRDNGPELVRNVGELGFHADRRSPADRQVNEVLRSALRRLSGLPRKSRDWPLAVSRPARGSATTRPRALPR